VAAGARATQPAADDSREPLSHLIAEVWHDLNQTLHLMRASLAPLLDLPGVADSPALSERARRVRQSCETLSHLLAEALDLSRLESHAVTPHVKSMATRPLLQSLVEHFSAKAEAAGVRIVLAAPSEDCAVLADGLMLHRVFANLLDNAIAYSRSQQTVLVALRYSQACCKLQVRDAGCGIESAEQGRVFDAHVRLSTDHQKHGGPQGSGLGLAIVKRLVLLMNGTVQLRSAPNRGCCVTVRLPRVHPPIAPNTQIPQQEPA
jgi:signal transduction histidine kinase